MPFACGSDSRPFAWICGSYFRLPAIGSIFDKLNPAIRQSRNTAKRPLAGRLSLRASPNRCSVVSVTSVPLWLTWAVTLLHTDNGSQHPFSRENTSASSKRRVMVHPTSQKNLVFRTFLRPASRKRAKKLNYVPALCLTGFIATAIQGRAGEVHAPATSPVESNPQSGPLLPLTVTRIYDILMFTTRLPAAQRLTNPVC